MLLTEHGLTNLYFISYESYQTIRIVCLANVFTALLSKVCFRQIWCWKIWYDSLMGFEYGI